MLKKDAIIPRTRVSQKTRDLAEQRAEELGLGLSEYIRFLVQKDIDEYLKIKNDNKK
ncbi:hypothetical protein [Dethiothermospora halolimnae]|uniref:hypothetical protein n=1 Tax=Dethiothermospora halolimnae TaxID=3114390 RepID=UPI003CCBE521